MKINNNNTFINNNKHNNAEIERMSTMRSKEGASSTKEDLLSWQ